jgi:hypothetical protein
MSPRERCHKHDRFERISPADSRVGPRSPRLQVVCFPNERVWRDSVSAMSDMSDHGRP